MEIKRMSIEDVLALPEGRTLEFKENLISLRPILKTLIAFANTAGGTLIIGRRDSGEVIGVENILAAEERLINVIADSIYPPLMPEVEIASVQGVSLLIIRVPHWRGPFFLKSKGEEKGVYVRLGSTNRAAEGELLAELRRSIMKVSFDQLPCPEVDSSGLDIEKVHEAFTRVGKVIDRHMLETLSILVPYNGSLVCSNGGLILFGLDKYRKKFFPNAEVRCARFQGTEKVHFIDQYDATGTILEAIDDVPKFIARNIRLAASIENIKRKDIPEYSPVIIREVLANALVHADYSIRGMNPRVAIFSDRMEIDSPGMFPFGYALDDFFAGVSHIRNKVIARIFRELNIIEEWGTGYRRIKETCLAGKYPLPHWEEAGTSLRVVFYPHAATQEQVETQSPIQLELTERQEAIKHLLLKEGSLPTKEIYNRLKLPISERTLRQDLLAMRERGVVTTVGQGPSTRWKIVT